MSLRRKKIDISKLSPERIAIAKIFKKHIEQAILEIGEGYIVDLQGRFDETPIRIEIEIASKKEDSITVLDNSSRSHPKNNKY